MNNPIDPKHPNSMACNENHVFIFEPIVVGCNDRQERIACVIAYEMICPIKIVR